jgi:hypothetical protein
MVSVQARVCVFGLFYQTNGVLVVLQRFNCLKAEGVSKEGLKWMKEVGFEVRTSWKTL